MDKWHLIQNQPLLREIYKEPPLISYRKGKSLKDMLVKQLNYKGFYQHNGHTAGVMQVCQSHLNRLKMNKLIGRTSHRLCTFPTSIREFQKNQILFQYLRDKEKKKKKEGALRKKGGVKIHPFHLPWIHACKGALSSSVDYFALPGQHKKNK